MNEILVGFDLGYQMNCVDTKRQELVHGTLMIQTSPRKNIHLSILLSLLLSFALLPSVWANNTSEKDSWETVTLDEPIVEEPTPAKQRVLVFTDPGGGGHMAASRAVQSILGEKYELKVITPLMYLPFVSSYNSTQKKGHIRGLQLLTSMQPVAEFIAKHFKTRQFLTSEILEFKPDLIISVIPLVNRLTQTILKENNLEIPTLILTTDLEVRHFFLGMYSPQPSVKVSLSFDDEALRTPLRKYFSDSNFISLGFPLRPEFGISPEEQQPKIDALRAELGISSSDKTVLIMMGAQGSGDAITKYAKKIATSSLGSENEKVHVVALCGSNAELKQRTEAISAMPHNPNVVIHALGVKPGDTIAALMRLANVLVSKPGGGSVNEAFASELYTLYHTDKTIWPLNLDILLPWEAGNMKYSIKKGWGERIKKKSFLDQLSKALNKPRIHIEDCPGRDFKQNLKSFVEHTLSGL